ncbi:MAG: hypothetical protein PVH00_12375 [Gemmatimonadota bacterium]|jgi:hypothetical protein
MAGRRLTVALVGISLAWAGVAGGVSAVAGVRGAELRTAAAAGMPRQNPLPFVVPSGPDPEFALSRDDGPGHGSSERRYRSHRPISHADRAAERSARSVRLAEGRRLDLAPGLARAGAGRLTRYATAPPKPVA